MNIIFKNCSANVLKIIASDYIASSTTEDNPEYIKIILDQDDKILWGKYTDNTETDIDLTGYTISGVSLTKIVKTVKKTM